MNRRTASGAAFTLAMVLAAAVVWRAAGSSRLGRPATVNSGAPARIASITLATDELLSELVPVDRVVSVTAFVDDPEISNVVGFYPPATPRFREADLERIVSLAPDLLCVAPYNSLDFLKQAERSGISIYRNEEIYSIDEIEAGIVALARRVGADRAAEKLVASMQQRRRELAARLEDVSERPRVLFWTSGCTSGRRTTTDDIIREAGGKNVAAEIGIEGPGEISPEQVVAADPDYLLLGRWSVDGGANPIAGEPVLNQLRAVREGRVVTIEGRYLSTVSQFVVAGAEQLARQLHPGRFSSNQTPAVLQRAR